MFFLPYFSHYLKVTPSLLFTHLLIVAQRINGDFKWAIQCFICFDITEEEAIARFGEPHFNNAEMQDSPGPSIGWAFRFECGLEIFIVFHQAKNFLEVYPHEPEIDHISLTRQGSE